MANLKDKIETFLAEIKNADFLTPESKQVVIKLFEGYLLSDADPDAISMILSVSVGVHFGREKVFMPCLVSYSKSVDESLIIGSLGQQLMKLAEDPLFRVAIVGVGTTLALQDRLSGGKEIARA